MKSIEISRKSGLSQSFISDILHRRRRPSKDAAKVLEAVTGISRLAWLYPDEYENPLIKARSVKEESGAA